MGSTGQAQRSVLDPTLLDQRESQYSIPKLDTVALETLDLPSILDPETCPIDFDSLYPSEPQCVSQGFPADSSTFLDSLTYGDMHTRTADFYTVGSMQTKEVPPITENILHRWSNDPKTGYKMRWEPDPPPRSTTIICSLSYPSEDAVKATRKRLKLKACIRCRMQRIRVSLLFLSPLASTSFLQDLAKRNLVAICV
jgi:hypothetical protein